MTKTAYNFVHVYYMQYLIEISMGSLLIGPHYNLVSKNINIGLPNAYK